MTKEELHKRTYKLNLKDGGEELRLLITHADEDWMCPKSEFSALKMATLLRCSPPTIGSGMAYLQRRKLICSAYKNRKSHWQIITHRIMATHHITKSLSRDKSDASNILKIADAKGVSVEVATLIFRQARKNKISYAAAEEELRREGKL